MKIIAAFILLVSLKAYGLTFKVIGKNSEVLFSSKAEVSLPQTVGEISVDFLNKNKIPFVGDIDGIVSIHEIGSELDVISDTAMKAYGWCYSLNGLVPEGFVHQVSVTDQTSELVWFYGYAYFNSGEWVSQCVPHGKETL